MLLLVDLPLLIFKNVQGFEISIMNTFKGRDFQGHEISKAQDFQRREHCVFQVASQEHKMFQARDAFL